VVGTGALTIGFSHRFDFEWSGGMYFDGGVIEVSTDGGATWADASTFTGVNPGYTGTLGTTSGNSLGGRRAYGRRNAAYPNRNTVSLTFGTQLAGRTIRLRFRIGTDAAAGGGGWEIDDLTFAGLTNTPFPVINAEGATCQAPPVVNAGTDLMATTTAPVQLAGTASDPNGDPLTLVWTQTGGPAVTLAGASTLTPTFTTPGAAATLTFQLAASDPFATSTDTVQVVVSMTTPIDAAIDAPTPIDAAIDAPTPIDAAIDAPTPIDAMEIDAAVPDDGGVEIDAAVPEIDAAEPPIDARRQPDAAQPTGDPDGGCCSTGGGGPTGSMLLGASALLMLRRRRRG
jgi:uncharacterized protein (TIGR03382 family)